MKTLTVTEGRGRLGYWLKRSGQGEDIGFMVDGKVIALRPVEIHSADYALQEYGLTPTEMEGAARGIKASIASERKRGTVKPFTGKLSDLRT
jgi:hypothetical protein